MLSNRARGIPATARPPSPAMNYHLRHVARIALLTGLATGILLAAVVFYITGEGGTSYWEISKGFALTRKMLGPVLLLSGLFLLLITALITWIISLYSTHRVAGPLFRFSRNLDREISGGPQPVEKIRGDDLLHEEYRYFSQAALRLQEHYDSLSEMTDLASSQMQLPDPNLGEGLSLTIKRLKEIESAAKL